jgi:hypothetical protein
MTGRPRSVVALAALASLMLAACGSESKNTAEPLPAAPTLTVPGKASTPKVTRTTTDTDTSTSTSTSTSTTPATTTDSNPSTAQGGAAPPSTGGAGTDTQGNDQQPADGSPAQRFEQFCKDNPGAC